MVAGEFTIGAVVVVVLRLGAEGDGIGDGCSRTCGCFVPVIDPLELSTDAAVSINIGLAVGLAFGMFVGLRDAEHVT